MKANQELVFIIFIVVYTQKFEEYLNLITNCTEILRIFIDLGVGHF